MPTTTECRHCKRKFIATHGNRGYCPETDCQKAKKAATQKKYYEISKDIVGGFLGNYKLLEETLGNIETTTVSLHEFQIKSFDQKAFYGSVKDDGQNAWYLVKDFGFRIFYKSPDNKLYVTIKKLLK